MNRPKARISGNVEYNLLEMAMGAEINGNMVHRKPQEKRLLEHKNDEAPASSNVTPEPFGTGH